jgi:Fe-S-cluster containining protein
MTGQQDLPAGTFSAWLLQIGRAHREGAGVDVPCGGCTACCTSSQFVHIAPDETQTLSRIPAELRFPAPGLPRGHVVLGYDEHGHCPMLVDGLCSIYEDRPRTCRSYDCRVFPAAGLEPDDADKARIVERTRRWKFDTPTRRDETLHAAVRAAATFLQAHAGDWPDGAVPRQPTQLAFLAIEIHHVFLDDDRDAAQLRLVSPPFDVVASAVRRARGTH